MMQPEEKLRQCNPDDPAFEGDEPYKVSPTNFFEVVKRLQHCPYCNYSDADEDGAFFDAAQCICKE